MSSWRYLLRRVGFALFAAYLVVSLTFAFVTFTPDPNQYRVAYQRTMETGGDAGEVGEAVSAYRQARNYDEPLLDRYANWMVDIVQLDWGVAYSLGEDPRDDQGPPVTTVVGGAIPHTLAYVLPAMLFSLVGGIAIGLYSATHQHSLFDRFGTAVAYLGEGVPDFWLAQVLLLVFVGQFGQYGQITASWWDPVKGVVLPAAVLGTSLLAGQVHYARAESLEYVGSEFIKLVRAKGASGWHVARHVLRNAAVPLLSLFFTELLGVLVVNVYVIEVVFGIPGLGQLSYQAIQGRDLPLILGTTLVIVCFGIGGNLVQDLAYAVLDPRIGNDDG